MAASTWALEGGDRLEGVTSEVMQTGLVVTGLVVTGDWQMGSWLRSYGPELPELFYLPELQEQNAAVPSALLRTSSCPYDGPSWPLAALLPTLL